MNPYIFKRKDEPIAIINLTEDGSIVNYKLNSKYERYICGIKQKRIVALVISLQKRQSFYYFRLLINFIIKCYGIFLAHGIKCVCLWFPPWFFWTVRPASWEWSLSVCVCKRVDHVVVLVYPHFAILNSYFC